jgi:hypothetical protein
MEVDLVAGVRVGALKVGHELVAEHSLGGEGPLRQVYVP